MSSKTILFVVLFIGACIAAEDPELKQCKHQCKVQRHFDEDQRRDCEKSCDEYYEAKKKREIRDGTDFELEKEEQEEGEEKYGDNPYVFGEEHFEGGAEVGEGRVRVLRKFTERSKILRGIENFRVSTVEANPSTFVIPGHFDADLVLFVAQGRATITVIKEKRASFELKWGDVFRIPSGTPFYLINKDERQKLKIVTLVQPTSVLGQFKLFQPSGQHRESFYTAFSWDLLEAAMKTPRDKLKSFFEQQKQGTIIKASREQIKSLSHHEEYTPKLWPFSEGDAERPINLLKQHPSQSNKFGNLFEALPSEFAQLRDLGVAVAFANITKGSMMAPHYNSKAMKIAMVVDGEGGFEMACPHQPERRSERDGIGGYQKIRGELKRGVVFVVPTGHPFSVFASRDENLQIVCFEVNAFGNMKYLLAGKDNIVNKMERMAKELGFNREGKEVERIFKQQDEEFFFPGPTAQQHQHQWAQA